MNVELFKSNCNNRPVVELNYSPEKCFMSRTLSSKVTIDELRSKVTAVFIHSKILKIK